PVQLKQWNLICVGGLLVGGVAGLAAWPNVDGLVRLPTLARTCLAMDDRPSAPDAGMVWIEGGQFKMGSEQFRPEEAPVREQTVAGFWIDAHDVTNQQFARFVRETGYVTVAERIEPEAGIGSKRGQPIPRGSMLFMPPAEIRD